MNTSTKILLGLLIAVIVVPLITAMTLKGKVNSKEFTTGNYNYSISTPQKGQFGPYKSIQISGPEANALTCVIDKSDQAGYEYMQFQSTDSVSVYVQNDTLYVKYVPVVDKNSNGRRSYNNVEVKLHLPEITDLSVDGSNVMIDVDLPTDNVKLKLKNLGSVTSVRTKPGENKSSMNTVPVGREETAINIEETEIESPVVKQTSASLDKEVKDVVIFHLM